MFLFVFCNLYVLVCLTGFSYKLMVGFLRPFWTLFFPLPKFPPCQFIWEFKMLCRWYFRALVNDICRPFSFSRFGKNVRRCNQSHEQTLPLNESITWSIPELFVIFFFLVHFLRFCFSSRGSWTKISRWFSREKSSHWELRLDFRA